MKSTTKTNKTMANKTSLAHILRQLRQADSFLITSHINPDGDAIGSVAAMGHLLQALGKTDIECVLSDPVTPLYSTLPGTDRIRQSLDTARAFDLAIILDVAQWERVGDAARYIAPAAKTIILDHHLEAHPAGDMTFIDTSYAATGEIIVELFLEAGIPFSREAAECAYVAQVTDTGGYRFSNTSARSHRLAAVLVETGIDVAGINQRLYDVISEPRIELLKRVLERRAYCHDHRVASSYLESTDLIETGASGSDMEGLVNYMRNIEGVQIGILFREVDEQTSKVSFRSCEKFNSASFLRAFGGGGHAAAAGATLNMPLKQARHDVMDCLRKTLEDAS